jgi:hypothetical protein
VLIFSFISRCLTDTWCSYLNFCALCVKLPIITLPVFEEGHNPLQKSFEGFDIALLSS